MWVKHHLASFCAMLNCLPCHQYTCPIINMLTCCQYTWPLSICLPCCQYAHLVVIDTVGLHWVSGWQNLHLGPTSLVGGERPGGSCRRELGACGDESKRFDSVNDELWRDVRGKTAYQQGRGHQWWCRLQSERIKVRLKMGTGRWRVRTVRKVMCGREGENGIGIVECSSYLSPCWAFTCLGLSEDTT